MVAPVMGPLEIYTEARAGRILAVADAERNAAVALVRAEAAADQDAHDQVVAFSNNDSRNQCRQWIDPPPADMHYCTVPPVAPHHAEMHANPTIQAVKEAAAARVKRDGLKVLKDGFDEKMMAYMACNAIPRPDIKTGVEPCFEAQRCVCTGTGLLFQYARHLAWSPQSIYQQVSMHATLYCAILHT